MTSQETISKKPRVLLERKEFYRSFGYDIEKERKFTLEKAGPIQGKILEIGTGKGHFTLELAKLGYKFISVDISEQAQEIARQAIKQLGLGEYVDFRVEDAEHLSFKDKNFKTIFSINTIHHLKNPLKVIDEMIRIMSPDGKIVLSDFTTEGFEVVNKIHKSEGRQHNKGKINLSSIKDYLANKGLETQINKSKFQQVLVIYR